MQRAQIKSGRHGDSSKYISLLRSGYATGKKSSSSAAMAGIALTAVAVGALLPSLQNSAHSKPADPGKVANKSVAPTVKPVIEAASATTSSRRPLDFYTGDVRATMFSEPVAPAPVEPKTAAAKPVAPEKVDPLADWSFTGSATIGKDTYAAVENINTHDSVLLKVGDDFEGGFKVDSIDSKFLTLTLGKEPKLLMVSMNSSYTPLSKSAAYLTAQPAANPAQGMDPAMLAKMGIMTAPGASGLTITLPNGRTITGDQATRYQQRLQQGWNGGQGGQGGNPFGGGGGFGGGGFGGGGFGGGGFGGGGGRGRRGGGGGFNAGGG